MREKAKPFIPEKIIFLQDLKNILMVTNDAK